MVFFMVVLYPDSLMRRSSEDSLFHLTLLAEILGIKSLPGSLELTTHLIETLNKVVQSLPAAQADVIYIQQQLMSAIESTSSKIKVCILSFPVQIKQGLNSRLKEVPNTSPNVIRIDVLVEVIRSMMTQLLTPLTLINDRRSVQKSANLPSGSASHCQLGSVNTG
jgi:hypothetical protein